MLQCVGVGCSGGVVRAPPRCVRKGDRSELLYVRVLQLLLGLFAACCFDFAVAP